jgi:hypothetical protein
VRLKEMMQSLSLQSTADKDAPVDLTVEVARLETLLAERRAELAALQAEFHAFRVRYTQVVGSRLSELADVERAVREAEQRLLGDAADAGEEEDASRTSSDGETSSAVLPLKTALRKLFWSVARMFHPDHAADETEARRRHTIMAEASRAYREGDAESLHTLLGDEGLQSYCAMPQNDDAEEDLASRLLGLKEELRTVEFGLKRIRQDRLYQLKQSVDAEAQQGRDKLAAEAERISRQIVKAKRRLEHLS